MKSPKTIKTDTPLQPVQTGHELDGIRVVSDASTVMTRSLGPFGASVSLICITAFLSIEFARSDTSAVVIGAIAVAAIAALSLYFTRNRTIASGPLSPP
jgi:hypothetical protein